MSEQEDHFLEHLKSELSLPTREEAIPMVTTVLQAFRRTLSRQNQETIFSRLPDFLKAPFRGIGREEKEISIEHLDELVTLVMQEDRSQRKLFKSEIQTLSVILFTLKKVFSLVDVRSMGLSKPLYQEVNEASR